MKNTGLKDFQKTHSKPKGYKFYSNWRNSLSVSELPNCGMIFLTGSVRSAKTLNNFKRKYNEIYGLKHT